MSKTNEKDEVKDLIKSGLDNIEDLRTLIVLHLFIEKLNKKQN